jgi:exodeoxyribonuclease-3
VRLATWNVNSVRAREGLVADWLERERPDLLLLQETKCEAHAFPAERFAALGYASEVVGQKSYNGVAVLARVPVTVTARALPGCEDQARYIEVDAESIRVGNLYLPNGNSGGEDGYAYKLRFMDALRARAETLLADDVPLVLAGDYNVAPADDDFFPGTLGPDDALRRPESRAAFRRLLWLGLTDAVRALHPTQRIWTFWDYQSGAWPQDRGLRIDHALLSAELADHLVSATPDRMERDRPQPSDHVPVVVEIAWPTPTAPA